MIISSPGKLMLFGEHAVVYNRHCLVAAINERLEISVERLSQKKLVVNFASVHHEVKIDDIDPDNFHDLFKFVEATVFNFYHCHRIHNGVAIKVEKHFSCDYGFGSSAAITASVAKGLYELFEIPYNDKNIFDLGYKSILDVQKVGSGFDLAASLFGGIVFFKTAGEKIEKLDANLDFITCYTGIKTSTAKIVLELKKRIETNRGKFEKIFDQIEQIVFAAEKELMGMNDPRILGRFMNKNQKKLKAIGVSSSRIDLLLETALKNGAYGGKISGAGVGDCVIILAPPAKRDRIEKELEKAGGKILNVKIDKEGTIVK